MAKKYADYLFTVIFQKRADISLDRHECSLQSDKFTAACSKPLLKFLLIFFVCVCIRTFGLNVHLISTHLVLSEALQILKQAGDHVDEDAQSVAVLLNSINT